MGSSSCICACASAELTKDGSAAAGQRQHAGRLPEPLDEGAAGRLAPQPGIHLGGEACLEITTFAIVHCFSLPCRRLLVVVSHERGALQAGFSDCVSTPPDEAGPNPARPAFP